MQRLSTTVTVTPKGRIINSCTVDYQTVFILIMETQVSKLTPKETESMLMLKKDTEHHNQLGFQLDTFGMDLSEYIFSDD
jgi:hypothetical protein